MGLVIVGLVITMGIISPWVAPYDFAKINLKDRFQAPSFRHLLGTDQLGRDILSRVLYGIRVSLLIGVLATLVAMFLGILLGAVSGYLGDGWMKSL